MQALADAMGLRALGAAVVEILNRERALGLVTFWVDALRRPLRAASVLGPALGQDPQDRNVMLVEERDHPVVEKIGVLRL